MPIEGRGFCHCPFWGKSVESKNQIQASDGCHRFGGWDENRLEYCLLFVCLRSVSKLLHKFTNLSLNLG